MTQWKRISTIVFPVCAAAGIVFGFLPRTWIELRFGVDPDGGSGLLEFLLATLPIAIGLGFALCQIRTYRSMIHRASDQVSAGRE